MEKDNYSFLRREMVRSQISARGISDPAVLKAFSSVARECFVPEPLRSEAYEDRPLSIGYGQTISQPFITALMTEHLKAGPGDKVLEIGTGSGYQAAVLADLGCRVYSLERVLPLAERAKHLFSHLELDIKVKVSDGTLGWEEEAPFSRIVVTAASPRIPEPLLDQLALKGRMIIPVGGRFEQSLIAVDKSEDGAWVSTSLCGCMFVPLIGEYGWQEDTDDG